MTLKKAFEYQNTVTRLLSETQWFLNRSYLFETRQNHKRQMANEKAQNEFNLLVDKRLIPVSGQQILDLLFELLTEKESITLAIDQAICNSSIQYNGMLECNKVIQSVVSILEHEVLRKSSAETETRGFDYMINGEGNQVRYEYPITEITTPTFDIASIRKKKNELAQKAEMVSDKIESARLAIIVDFEQKFENRDTAESILEERVKN